MDFYVFDNIYTYDKLFSSARSADLGHLEIKQIVITEKGAFWFETDMNREDHNVNVNRPYLHLHKGIHSLSQMQFKKEPYFIHMKDIIYNPIKKEIQIYKPGGIWPWSKPIFVKHVVGKYYGMEIPVKPIKTRGKWIFDHGEQRISVILDYFTG